MKKRLILVAFVVCVPALWAADGVIEINQAAVEANGGFPYVIREPGSYILTGNLTVPDENTTAIQVQADDVTLDLNGFAIQCSDSDGASCDQPSTSDNGDGVTGFLVTEDFRFEIFVNTVVRNGTIRGMGGDGVELRSGFVEGVQALGNKRSGILVGEGAVTDCLAENNFQTGIVIGTGVATINVARLNRGDGIEVREGGVARNNVSESNGGDGIESRAKALIMGNRVRDNSGAALNLIPEQAGDVSGYADNVIEGAVTGGQPIGCNLIDGDQICPGELQFNTR